MGRLQPQPKKHAIQLTASHAQRALWRQQAGPVTGRQVVGVIDIEHWLALPPVQAWVGAKAGVQVRQVCPDAGHAAALIGLQVQRHANATHLCAGIQGGSHSSVSEHALAVPLGHARAPPPGHYGRSHRVSLQVSHLGAQGGWVQARVQATGWVVGSVNVVRGHPARL